MDRQTLSRLPFMVAFYAALAGMPLDIFDYHQREVGFAKLNPWQRKLSAAVERIGALSGRLLALIQTPRFWQTAVAAAVLILVATHQIHASAGVGLLAGLTATEAREKANKLGTDMKTIVDACKTEAREMTKDEETKFDAMDKDREVLLSSERRMLRIEELETGQGRRSEPMITTSEQRGNRQAGDADKLALEHEDALRAWFAAQLKMPLTKKQEENCRQHGIDPRSEILNIRRPKVHMRSLRDEDQKRWENRASALYEQRALSTLTSSSPEDGSYLIANEAMRPLERAMLAYGGVRNTSTVLRTRTGANLPIPTSDDTSNEGYQLSENTQVVEKDTEFGQLVLGAWKFSSKKVLVSRELFQDSNEDLGAFMFTALGERLARAQNRAATVGTGSSTPNGIVTAATSSAVALAAQTPTYAELVSIEATVDPAYRAGAGWMFHDTLLQEVKKIVETTTGRPIWLPTMAGGAPDTILGYPYTINQHMAVAASSGSGKSILFGQLSKYLYREVQDIEVMRLNELYAEYYQVAFVGFSRFDGDLLDAGTHPVKYASNHA